MGDKKSYLFFPQRVKNTIDIINGVGKKEMLQITLLVAIVNLINIIVYLINHNVVFLATYFFASVAMSVLLFMKDDSNTSFADQLRFLIRHQKSNKKYRYYYFDEWR